MSYTTSSSNPSNLHVFSGPLFTSSHASSPSVFFFIQYVYVASSSSLASTSIVTEFVVFSITRISSIIGSSIFLMNSPILGTLLSSSNKNPSFSIVSSFTLIVSSLLCINSSKNSFSLYSSFRFFSATASTNTISICSLAKAFSVSNAAISVRSKSPPLKIYASVMHAKIIIIITVITKLMSVTPLYIISIHFILLYYSIIVFLIDLCIFLLDFLTMFHTYPSSFLVLSIRFALFILHKKDRLLRN